MTRFRVVMPVAALARILFIISSASCQAFPPGLQLIAVGGNNGRQNIADVEVITLSSNTHTVAAPLPTNLSNFGSTKFNDTIYIVGGESFRGYQNSFLAYNVAENMWTTLPDFPFNILANGMVAIGNAIYSIGGYAQNYGYMNYTYKYDLNEHVWSKLPALLPVITVSPCAVADESDNNIYYLSSGDLYRTSDGANTWKQLSSMILNRNVAGCALLPKTRQILVAGGTAARSEDTGGLSELYDIATDTWKTAARMNHARDMASAVVVPGDDVVVCGGENFYWYNTYADCELYSATNNQWKALNITLNERRRSYGLFATQV